MLHLPVEPVALIGMRAIPRLGGLRFCRSRRKALKDPAGALHVDADRCTLSIRLGNRNGNPGYTALVAKGMRPEMVRLTLPMDHFLKLENLHTGETLKMRRVRDSGGQIVLAISGNHSAGDASSRSPAFSAAGRRSSDDMQPTKTSSTRRPSPAPS